MTTINSQEDFLRALRENPEWKDAVRALILGEELLQLPTRFNAFVDEQRQVNGRVESRLDGMASDISDLKAGQRRIENRMDRQERDSSALKDWYISALAVKSAETLPIDLGVAYVRTLSETDLDRMIRAAMPVIPLNEIRSFRRADMVIEAQDDSGTVYIVMEASYTADLRDSDRAQRNARLLTEFTGHRAIPVVASVRNVNEVSALVESGDIYWYEIEDHTTPAE